MQSRRHQDEVCLDRIEQLAIKAELERKRQEDEQMYAILWEKDRLAKAAREEKEAQEQIERNRLVIDNFCGNRLTFGYFCRSMWFIFRQFFCDTK